MKFMVSWSLHPDKRLEVLNTWCALTPEERANPGDGLRLIGRWHCMAESTGVAIIETEDASKLFRYLGTLNPVMNLKVSLVVDDEESASAGQLVLDDLSA